MTPAEIALAEAERLHAAVVRMSAAEVDEMFMAGIGWIPDNRQSCGTYVARCYAPAGLRADVRKYGLPSTYRLDRFGRGLKISGKWSPPVTAISRIVQPADIQRGDIVCIRTNRRLPVGDHVTLCAGFDGKLVSTFEYNASGLLGNGQTGRGVVTNKRPIAVVVKVYRLQPEDFDPF